jgi:pimeloyl-ACP methyl ester carboxylesterase
VPEGERAVPSARARLSPRLDEVLVVNTAGFYRLRYAEWGRADAQRVVVCVHGVSRNGHDFDYLAANLAAAGMRVVVPDLPGRGRSDWLPSSVHYDNPAYLTAMATLVARIGAREVDWVGSSLGGYIGMHIASLPHNPIRRLVLNDFGARVGHAALRRIAGYLRAAPQFRDVGGAELYLREVLAPFGRLSDEKWQHIARHSVVKGDDGKLHWHYDPAIAANFSLLIGFDVVLWQLWDEISCPVLLMRGEDSDLLSKRTFEEMLERGPAAAAGKVTAIEWPDCGHAPSLMIDAQIAAVRDFLMVLQ